VSRLRITEIFYSLQGETRTVGWPTVFVRLTGCPLRCTYCDTAYAFQGGKWWSLAQICEEVQRYQPRYVTVTGGEPLAQKNCLQLLAQLCDQNYIVSLETSGALDIAEVDPRVVKVVDIKTPSSNECKRNLYSNIAYLLPQDQVKFVIGNREDYEWAKTITSEYQLLEGCEVLFSPSYKTLPANELAQWILDDRLTVRLQIQLHKYLWGEEQGR
jgi:7-carboxy-7-deazaguanine synthase